MISYCQELEDLVRHLLEHGDWHFDRIDLKYEDGIEIKERIMELLDIDKND